MGPPKHPREKALLATIFLLNAVEFLQAGMIAFSAGPIMGHVGASPEEFTLATVVYAVVAICAIAHQGRLVERMGWRGFIQASVAVFVAGAAICGTSSTFGQFMLGRAVMGLGGAAFMTSARLLVNLMPPSPRRFLGIGVFASALAIGNALAPWLAAEAVARAQWNMIFTILGGAALAAAGCASLCLPAERTPREQRTDGHPLATLCLVGGCFLMLYALQHAPYDFYSDALPLLGASAGGAALLWYFVRGQRNHARPLLVLARLGQARYLSGLALFTLCYIVLGANSYMLGVLTQRALGFTSEAAGAVLGAGLLAALAAFWIMAAILRRKPSPKKFYVAGFLLLATSGGLLMRINGDAGLWGNVFPAIAGYGAFIILVMGTTAIQAFSGLQHDAQAFNNGQQLKNMMSQFGIAAGVAGAALGLQWRSGEHYAALAARFSSGDPAFADAAGQLTLALTSSQGPQAAQVAVGHLAQQLNQQTALLASLDYFAFVTVFALIGAVVMALQRAPTPAGGT